MSGALWWRKRHIEGVATVHGKPTHPRKLPRSRTNIAPDEDIHAVAHVGGLRETAGVNTMCRTEITRLVPKGYAL